VAYQAVKENGRKIEKAARSSLSNEEEETLVSHAEVMAQLGHGFSNRHF
jgi:hypothetical protein